MALLRLCGNQWDIRRCLDDQAIWIPGEGQSGRHAIVLHIAEGMIDTTGFCTKVDEVFPESAGVRGLCEAERNLHWHDFFRSVCSGQGHVGMWLYTQLVWAVGDRLNEQVVRHSAGQVPVGGSGAGASLEVSDMPVLSSDARHVAQELQRYVTDGAAIFQQSQFVSMAPDASKIGDKGLLVAPMVDARSGVAMWAAPQVGLRYLCSPLLG